MAGARGITPQRKQLLVEIRQLREQGHTFQEISDELGISVSHASATYHDPTGKKERQRKERYSGNCEICGKPTSGSNGPGKAPKTCQECNSRRLIESRRWNEETVIRAIQAWAAEHGRPPIAMEWINAGVTADDVRHPSFSSVYRSVGNPYAPFASWADAIEAAGFPRPKIGQYARRKRSAPHYWNKLRARVEDQRWLDSLSDAKEEP